MSCITPTCKPKTGLAPLGLVHEGGQSTGECLGLRQPEMGKEEVAEEKAFQADCFEVSMIKIGPQTKKDR